MRYDAGYIDAGAGYYERRDQRNREHLVRYHQNALARLGVEVIVTPPGDGAPPPPTPDNPGQAA
jgi:sugar phosphate isomerase/epimerase